ncbi:MAG TPA: CoA ester lyase [Solirubrobacteraceae bacterium]|nr:CoA ester lyase [Solirubrobacteraceae bacterium]
MSSKAPLEPWPRAWLFTPADDRRKLDSALRSDAEAVIADLEDAVAPARKDIAREHAMVLLDAGIEGATGSTLVLRINDPRSEHGANDLQALGARSAVDVVAMVPKATLETVALAHATGASVVALIETPQGLVESEAIATADGVLALAIGTVDLAAELGLGELSDGLELLHARSRIVVAGALGGVPVLDGVYLNLDDTSGLQAEAERARALGFAGKLCIHPRQLASVREAFTPTAAELERARDVVADYERMLADGQGVAASGGEMQDAATVRRARRMLGADFG